MAVKTSGSLGLSGDIRAEFGGAAPHAISEYYRGGGRVGTNNTQVPTSGEVQFSDFRGATNTIPVQYELIGAGSGGGGGNVFYTTTVTSGGKGGTTTTTSISYGGPGGAGGSSSITYGSTTVTSPGGTSPGSSTGAGLGTGERTIYGNGGAEGLNSDSGNWTPGGSAPASSYGAGGGGGGAYNFANGGGASGNAGGIPGTQYILSGYGGSLVRNVGLPTTGTVNLVPGSTISITVGSGGAGGSGRSSGGRGANGYVRIIVGGTTRFSSSTPGSYTFTVPSS